LDALAGLARLARVEGDYEQARRRVMDIMRVLESHSLLAADEPGEVYAVCSEMLDTPSDDNAWSSSTKPCRARS